jgi:hypothetical protein
MPTHEQRWSSLYVEREDPNEPTSALCCVVTAAIHLGAIARDDHAIARVLGRLGGDFETGDVAERALRAMTDAAGLTLKRWRAGTPGAREAAPRPWVQEPPNDERVWLVRKKETFRNPTSAFARGFRGVHFCLVVEAMEGSLVVADPSPFRVPVQFVPDDAFARAWVAAGGSSAPWAACLRRGGSHSDLETLAKGLGALRGG